MIRSTAGILKPYVSINPEILTSTYSIFLVGGFESFGESYAKDYSIVRIDTDGVKDTNFNNQDKFAISSDFRLSKQTPDGYILTVSTDPVTHDGTIDSTFNDNGYGAQNTIYDLSLY